MSSDDYIVGPDGTEWGIDPTGRHDYRSRLDGHWSGHVTSDPSTVAEATTDWVGARMARRDDPDDANDPGSVRGCAMILGASAAVVVVMVAVIVPLWNWASDGDSSPQRTVTVIRSDALARSACEHFRNIESDAVDGVLGADQVLPKLREVYDTAKLSDTQSISQAATAMLAEVTAGGDGEQSIRGMRVACTDIGS